MLKRLFYVSASVLMLALLAVTASVASAGQGVSLRWNACFGDGGTINRTFACDTNVGTHVLEGSFELGADLLGVGAVFPVVDLATASPVLPEWWEIRNPGSCRQLALFVGAPLLGINCVDWADSGASVNQLYDANFPAPNAARIRILSFLVPGFPDQNLSAGEYAVFHLVINNAGTLGATCTGCEVPACIVFNSSTLFTADQAVVLSGPTNQPDSHYVTWQGGAGVTVPGRGDGCPAATPTKNATWSQVKSLYR